MFASPFRRSSMYRLLLVGLLALAFFPSQRLESALQDPADKPAAPLDARLFRQLFAQRANTAGVFAVSFSPDGNKVISGGMELNDNGRPDGPPNVKIWDANTGQQLLAVRNGGKYDGLIGFSPDGKRFVSYGIRFLNDPSPATHIWDATNGQAMVSLEPAPLQAGPKAMVFSPDGKHILGCGSKPRLQPDRRVGLWDAATGRMVRNFSAQLTEPQNEYVDSVAFSPDGKKFATIGGRTGPPVQVAPGVYAPAGVGLVRIWDLESGKVKVTNTLSFVTRGLAFGPAGKVVVAGFEANGPVVFAAWVKVYDARDGREALSLKTHGIGAKSVCCSPDGKWIASGNNDGTIRVWNAETGKELAILRGHINVINSVAFSPDGTKIASGSSDGTVRIWGIPGNQQPLPK
jgi:WD40 repeat protein